MDKDKNTDFCTDGLYFSCNQCSTCCRFDPGFVFLSENDLSKLLEWAFLKREEFIQVYCRWVRLSDDFEYLSLREKSNCDCILWKEGCTAYEFRPLQCSTFPFWDAVVKDKASWDLYSCDCPGMGKGKFYSADEINNILGSQKKEPCIKRKRIVE